MRARETLESMNIDLDETHGKLVRIYTKVDLFLQGAFAAEKDDRKRM